MFGLTTRFSHPHLLTREFPTLMQSFNRVITIFKMFVLNSTETLRCPKAVDILHNTNWSCTVEINYSLNVSSL